ncbi:MAG: sigma-70 family RNA polymerase sigma factor [Clostridiales bacterium]|nr:sigma-70 family RNA polymerase sigma factor [Clostridiales bacterium]
MTNQELEKIYTESYRAVYWTAMSLLKNEADAEDIVQETFLTLIKSYDTIKDKSKVTSWLKKTAANKCLDRIKLTKTVNVDDEVLENIETVPENFLPDSLVESEAMRKIIMDIIEKILSEDVRRTIILFYFDEMSTKEISDLLGVPQGTVLWRLNFARNKIKKEVEKYEEESNTKLFAVPLPFLTQLFTAESEQVPLRPMPAGLYNLLSASSEAASTEAGEQIAAEAVRKGIGFTMKKIIIFICAAVLSIGAVTALILYKVNDNKNNTPETRVTVSKKDKDQKKKKETDKDKKATEDTDDSGISPVISDGSEEIDPSESTDPNVSQTEDDYIRYPVGDLSAEEMVDLYQYYQEAEFSIPIGSVDDLEGYLKNPIDRTERYDMARYFSWYDYSTYDSTYPWRTDCVTAIYLDQYDYDSCQKTQVFMSFTILDEEKALAIVDAFVARYTQGTYAYIKDEKEIDPDSNCEVGYLIRIDDDCAHMISCSKEETPYGAIQYDISMTSHITWWK